MWNRSRDEFQGAAGGLEGVVESDDRCGSFVQHWDGGGREGCVGSGSFPPAACGHCQRQDPRTPPSSNSASQYPPPLRLDCTWLHIPWHPTSQRPPCVLPTSRATAPAQVPLTDLDRGQLDFIPGSWKRYWNQTCQSVLTLQWSPAHWGFMLHLSLGTNPRMSLLGSIVTLCAVGAMGFSGNSRFLFVLWLLLYRTGCESKLSRSSQLDTAPIKNWNILWIDPLKMQLILERFA